MTILVNELSESNKWEIENRSPMLSSKMVKTVWSFNQIGIPPIHIICENFNKSKKNLEATAKNEKNWNNN